MIDLSSSDTKEALELLSLSPARGCHSPLLNLWSSFDSDLFEDWPKAGMAASVYVALTTYASSSRASTFDYLRGGRKSCIRVSSARRCRSRVASSTIPQW
jgi:hypothetical protein